MEYENIYSTKDFYSACILRVLDFPLLRLERNPHDITTFVFLNSEEKAEQTIQDYWDRKIQILDARKFVEVINELKTRIYER